MIVNIFLGDPDDYSLRKIEQNVVITKIVREKAKYEKCAEQNKSILNLVYIINLQYYCNLNFFLFI